MYTQKTIKKAVSCAGVGVHSGQRIEMTLKPAGVDSGILFRRADVSDSPVIKVTPHNIIDVSHATTLGREGVMVQTVEHVLSAVHALGISNLQIELTGSETPFIDGSAACFVNLLLDAGIESQRGNRRVIQILQTVEVRGNDSIITVEPYDGMKITYTIDFPNPFIGIQTKAFELHPLAYEQEIAHARTFCLYEQVEYLWKMGLSKGGSLDNTVVFAQDRILNGSLRYEDEPIRHKILDLIGDLALLSHPLLGHIKVYKGSHALHTQFVKSVLAQADHWTYLTGQALDSEVLEPAEMLRMDENSYQSPHVFA